MPTNRRPTKITEAERLRLVERVIHDLADAARGAAPARPESVVGLWADEPDIVDEIVERTMRGREQRRRGC